MSSINITPGRIKVLKEIERAHGLYASGIADLFPRKGLRIWSSQGATRFGCGYAQPLVNAGLLRKDTSVPCGGARYFITAGGEAAIIANESGATA
jgi:hypothetical protein